MSTASIFLTHYLKFWTKEIRVLFMANLANVCFSFESFVFMKHLERARFFFIQWYILHSKIIASIKHLYSWQEYPSDEVVFHCQWYNMQIRTPTSLFPERGCELFAAPPCSVLVVLIDYFDGGVSRKPLPNIWHFGCVCLFVWMQSGWYVSNISFWSENVF